MKVLLISVGTRGDVEPFLSVAQLLDKNGHEVCTAFPAQYAYLAEESNIKCLLLNKSFIELIEGPEAKMLMGGKLSLIQKIKGFYRMYKASTQVNQLIFKEQHDFVKEWKPDRIVYSGKAVYPILWSKINPGKAILLSPVPCLIHPVKHLPHLGFHQNLGPLNGLTYKLANYGLMTAVRSVSKSLLETQAVGKKEISALIKQNKMIYAISPNLFPKPKYWPNYVSVLGYQERNKKMDWQPDTNLSAFIAKHPKLLFVSFGSMTNPEPKRKTDIILKVLNEQGIPAIVNCAEGGLLEPDIYNKEQFYFVNRIPYDWILPQVYGIVHHGGSGTTHLGLKYGCASLIVPHIIDQYLWNTLISKNALGPKGNSIHKITAKKLTPDIIDLWNNPIYKKNAQVLGKLMQSENFDNEILSIIVGN